ncbi:hypothetical protein Gasu2_35230 [Galdieria sulphuraria]|uniref:Uncharacterized protein n=1 Tax=Galdieria sulphuraria TaxID=130081 RepID=M2VW22_GALSU|nr:uncharacterized protein Gasu_50200 [Galdieria sulphuraria]EME27426.1 hypothetical protein Gasu_50200 [Galdieria sulphuraria]GJD09263.1 hypothetical protein Gasu2_35230 [Galdieria sulphuraria]|eukprot:XP_005703946.1 hypothetical protein Gasu_50200 [Galdieria sulphuraria]
MNRIYQAVSSLFQNHKEEDDESDHDSATRISELSAQHPSSVVACTNSSDSTQVICIHIFSSDLKKAWFYSQDIQEGSKIGSVSSDLVTDDAFFPKTCFIAFIQGKSCKLYSLDGRLVYIQKQQRHLFVASKEQVETENTQSEFWIEERRTGIISLGICSGQSGDFSDKRLRYVCLERNGAIVADRKVAKSWEQFCLIPVPLSYANSPRTNITVRILDHRGRFLTIGDHGKVCFHSGPFAAIRDSISFEYSKDQSICRLRSTWNGHYLRLDWSDSKRPFLVADGENESCAAVFQVHWHNKAFFSLKLSTGFVSCKPNGSLSCTSLQDSTWERLHLSSIISCVPKDAQIAVRLERKAHSRRVIYSSVVIPCDCRTAFSVISDYDHLKCFCRHVMESCVKRQIAEDEYEIQTIEQHGFLFFSKKSQQLLRVKEFYPHNLRIELIESNMLKEYQAMWTVEPLQEAELCCFLSLHVSSKPKSSIPGFLLDSVCKGSCLATMEDIQKECIRRMKCYHS